MEFSQNAFSAPLRTLTGFGSTTMPIQALLNQSLAASATVSLAPVGGVLRFANIGLKAGAAGSAVIQITDGTNIFVIVTVATGTNGGTLSTVGNSTIPVQIKNNDAANPATWALAGADFTQ